jgi:hypothetical protein|tara:strand:+ start:162 stop:326 length:165 start_codon:yes stop_codon:yes gene_type:complete
MAKIHEEIIIIKLSKLVKETDELVPISSQELVANLAAVAEELAGAGVVVEIEQA